MRGQRERKKEDERGFVELRQNEALSDYEKPEAIG